MHSVYFDGSRPSRALQSIPVEGTLQSNPTLLAHPYPRRGIHENEKKTKRPPKTTADTLTAVRVPDVFTHARLLEKRQVFLRPPFSNGDQPRVGTLAL